MAGLDLSELNRHLDLIQKLQRVQELHQTVEAKCLGAQALTGMPHGTGVSDKVGALAAELADLSSRMDYLKKEVEKSAKPIEEYINSIDDDRTRLIFRFRFLYGLAWCEVADLMGPGTSEDAVKSAAYRRLVTPGDAS